MAVIALTAAGSAVGGSLFTGVVASALGAAAGGYLGSMLGSSIDNAIFGAPVVGRGARLDNLRVQDSRYGAALPLLYGTMRLAGQMIWASPIRETVVRENAGGGGKGGGGGSSGTVEKYYYDVHLAVALAQGPVSEIRRIWADSKIIYDEGWIAGYVQDARIYHGSNSQNPDTLIEAFEGSANTPAYRGVAYIVIEGLQLRHFGNRVPNITFELCGTAPSSTAQLASTATGADIASGDNMQPQPLALSDNEYVIVQYTAATPTTGEIIIKHYGLTDAAPAELSTVSSTVLNSRNDLGIALSPDRRWLLCYSNSLNDMLLYDTQTRSFGAVLTPNPDAPLDRVAAWLNNDIVLVAGAGTIDCLKPYRRVGKDLLPLPASNGWAGAAELWPDGALQRRSDNSLAAFAFDVVNDIYYAQNLSWQNDQLVQGALLSLPASISGYITQRIIRSLGAGEYLRLELNASIYYFSTLVLNNNALIETRLPQIVPLTPGFTQMDIQTIAAQRFMLLSVDDTKIYTATIELTPTGFSILQDWQELGTLPGIGFVTGRFCRITGQRLLAYIYSGLQMWLTDCRFAKNGSSLAHIVGDILQRAGYAPSEIDVTALQNTNMRGLLLSDASTARAALEPLRAKAPFDLIEHGGILRARLQQESHDITIAPTELRCATEGETLPAALTIRRTQERELPHELVLDYIDDSRDYLPGSQRARRQAGMALAVNKVSLPMALSATEAKQLAEQQLFNSWLLRNRYEFSLSRRYLMLEAGDVVSINGQKLRLQQITQAGQILRCVAAPIADLTLSSTANAESGNKAQDSLFLATPADTRAQILDIPLLRDEDDQAGFYVTLFGAGGWRGGSLLRALDGQSFSTIAQSNIAPIAGQAMTALPDGPTAFYDNANSVQISLNGGELNNVAELALLSGANTALLGDEIIQFRQAVLLAPGLYELRSLLRGRRGTEWATSTHNVGEKFVLLSAGGVQFTAAHFSDYRATYYFRAVSTGAAINDTPSFNATYAFNTLRPFAPVHVSGTRDDNGNLSISWVRRARKQASWNDHSDVPLDEAQEQYEIEILNSSGAVVRLFNVSASNTQLYSAAQQSADFGAAQTVVDIRLYQISGRIGRGWPASASL